AIREHAFLDVSSGKAHHLGHSLSEGFLATQSEHRHGEFTFGKKVLVVDGILVKCGKLHGPGMHAALHGVQTRIMIASVFEPAGRGRELVPETVEINAFAAGDEALHVRTAKAKMPEQRVFEDFFPWSDIAQRRVNLSKPCDALRMLRGKRIADHVANVVGHQRRAVDFDVIKHPRHVAGLGLLSVAVGRFGGESKPTQIWYDDGVVPGKVSGHRHPHVSCLTIAMQQNNRWPRAANAHVDEGVVDRDKPGDKFWRKLEGSHVRLQAY